MQHLEVSCAVRRFFKSLGFKGLNLRNKLVKSYIWSTLLYGAENWTFRKVDQKQLESSYIMVLLRDVGHQFNRSCERWSVTWRQGEEYPTNCTKKVG